MKSFHIYFKSESCDTYQVYIQAKKKPTEKQVLKWLFLDYQVEGDDVLDLYGVDSIDDIPYGDLEINEIEFTDFNLR